MKASGLQIPVSLKREKPIWDQEVVPILGHVEFSVLVSYSGGDICDMWTVRERQEQRF